MTLLKSFAVTYQFKIQFLVFDDAQDWNNNSSQILIATINQQGQTETPYLATLQELKKVIRHHSGGPVYVGEKGLVWSTSALECHLSRTDSLYPGDVDLVILDANGKARSVVEFKKHTLSPSIDDQTFSNYYPNPDKRKYDRLKILTDYLCNISGSVNLSVIFYPTIPQGTKGRFEQITGTVASLVSNQPPHQFNLPQTSSEETSLNLIDELFTLNYI